jgi:redox-sensitive bicupin YhaK (pirin superfamily)
MKRKDFLKKGILGLGALTLGKLEAGTQENVTEKEETISQVGFNHLPEAENLKIANNMILHKADSRGYANHGWLESRFTFSFASYYNPQRMHFGTLRVLNDDIIGEGRGFGMHPHDNMEIISVPISGALEHKDNMGNSYVISDSEVQVMSAGTGIYHSEYNPKTDQKAKFLQIWVFTKNRNATPRYGQMKFSTAARKNRFQLIVSPNQKATDHLWIHQDAWFHLSDMDKGKSLNYKVNLKGNGLYIFVLEGKVNVNGQDLDSRDGLGITDFTDVNFTAQENCRLLLMEVPMR